jgi:hypothetical protein
VSALRPILKLMTKINVKAVGQIALSAAKRMHVKFVSKVSY